MEGSRSNARNGVLVDGHHGWYKGLLVEIWLFVSFDVRNDTAIVVVRLDHHSRGVESVMRTI